MALNITTVDRSYDTKNGAPQAPIQPSNKGLPHGGVACTGWTIAIFVIINKHNINNITKNFFILPLLFDDS